MKKARLVLATALATVTLSATSVVASADPDAVESARQELARIQSEASALDQQIIEANARVESAEAKLAQLQSDLSTQEQQVNKLTEEIGDIASVQLYNDSMDITAQLLASSDSDTFLSGLGVFQNEVERSTASIQQLHVDQARLTSLRDNATATEKQLAQDRDAKIKLAEQYDEKESEAQEVYNRLSAEERARLEALEQERIAAAEAERSAAASRSRETNSANSNDNQSQPSEEQPDAAPAGSGAGSNRAQTAVQAAMAQVGKPYIWGGTGPGGFDCSGLMLYAYRQVGVSLPRVASAQAGVGSSVSKSALQPGDLVFFYFPISHVGMYIGDGKMVHASNSRTGVIVSKLSYNPQYNTARRVA